MLTVSLLAVLTLSTSAVTVQENGDSQQTTEIAAGPENADYDVQFAIVQKMTENTNNKIIRMVLKELSKKAPDIEKLIAETNELAADLIVKAEKFGIYVICEYTSYEFNGIVFYIDPLIVIRR